MPQGPGTSYSNRHWRVRNKYGKASQYGCWYCDTAMATEWAWVHGTDPNDPDSYIPLCKPCHSAYDGAPWLGRKMTMEQRAVLSRAHVGNKQSQATKDIRSKALKGKPWSAARKAAERNRKLDPEDSRRTFR